MSDNILNLKLRSLTDVRVAAAQSQTSKEIRKQGSKIATSIQVDTAGLSFARIQSEMPEGVELGAIARAGNTLGSFFDGIGIAFKTASSVAKAHRESRAEEVKVEEVQPQPQGA